MIDQRERLAREGMYRPEFESDACGVGLVAATDGRRGASSRRRSMR
jgi:glutamate synthase (NADPH/NADH) large chain